MSWFDEQNLNGWLAHENTALNDRMILPGATFGTGPADPTQTGATPMPTTPATAGGTLQAGAPTNQIQTGGGQYPLASVAGEGLLAPFNAAFQRPDVSTFQDNPAYKFRFDQGLEALQRSAAAKGTLLTGGTLKDLTAFGQGLASQEYDKEYDRALGLYDRAENTFFNNSNMQFNRLGSLSGIGQTSAGQLGQQGSSFGSNASDLITGAGNANAAGQVGSANAWSNTLGNLGNLAIQYAFLNQK